MKDVKTRLRQLGQAAGLVWASAPGWTTLNLIVVILQGLLPAVSLYLTKAVVDALSLVLAQSNDARSFEPLLILLPFVIGLALAGWLFRALSSFAGEAQSTAVTQYVQGILHKKAAQVDYQCYEDPSFHNMMRMAHGEAASRPTSIVRNMSMTIKSVFSLAAVSMVLFLSHSYLVPVVILAVIPGTVARILNSRARHDWRLKHAPKERYAGYLNTILTAAPFAKELRVFDHGDSIQNKWKNLRTELRKHKLALTRRRLTRQILADAFSYLIAAGGIGLIFLKMKTDRISPTMGDMAMLFRALQAARGALSSWLMGLTALYEDSLFVSHYHEFMELPQRIQSPDRPKPFPEQMQSGIRIENVTFRYPGTAKDVLKNVSCIIKPGEHVALVGENGAGKTTLAKLLCRLYDPTSGRITIDGTDLREFSLKDLRQWMGVLFQDYVRYFMTAEENIRIGNCDLGKNDSKIKDAAYRSGAAEVIDNLPHGYDTMLGRMFEDGCELSTGQWQRLALARTLVRDAKVVLLDEHTSALDPKAEHAVLRQLFKSVSNITALIISHRLSTVTMVDRIIVLHNGEALEEGTHEELLKTGEKYKDLFVSHVKY